MSLCHREGGGKADSASLNFVKFFLRLSLNLFLIIEDHQKCFFVINDTSHYPTVYWGHKSLFRSALGTCHYHNVHWGWVIIPQCTGDMSHYPTVHWDRSHYPHSALGTQVIIPQCTGGHCISQDMRIARNEGKGVKPDRQSIVAKTVTQRGDSWTDVQAHFPFHSPKIVYCNSLMDESTKVKGRLTFHQLLRLSRPQTEAPQ